MADRKPAGHAAFTSGLDHPLRAGWALAVLVALLAFRMMVRIGNRHGLSNVAGGEAGPVHSAGMLLVDNVSWPVADLRIDWHDDDPVGADRPRGPSERGHPAPHTRRVAGIDDHGEVRLLLRHGHPRQVERVPRRRLERPDPSLAQDDLGVPALGDVLRRLEPLVDRHGQPALQHHRHDGVVAGVEKLKGHPLFAHVTLTRSERSPIAALVTDLLDM